MKDKDGDNILYDRGALAKTKDAQKAICEAFGLNPNYIKTITIVMSAKDVLRLEVGYIVTCEQLDKFTETVKKYRMQVGWPE